MSREADGETTNSVRPTRLLKFTKVVTPRGYHDTTNEQFVADYKGIPQEDSTYMKLRNL